jgi:mycoredoxin
MNRPSLSIVILMLVVTAGGWNWWQKHHQQVVMAQAMKAKYADLVKENETVRAGRTVINLYTATWCGYCEHLKASLDASGVPYLDHDVENSEEGKSYSDAHHFDGVPVTVVGSEIVEGYDANRLESVFYHAGYKVGGLQM